MSVRLCVLLGVFFQLVAGEHKLLADRADELFSVFKEKFKKQYSNDEEETFRRKIFVQSMKRADKRNALNGHPSFGVTKFSDLTEEEFSVYLGRKSKGKQIDENKIKVRNPAERRKQKNLGDEMPAAIDWKTMGKVTPIKNQGQCGSCWAFSAAEAVESAWAMEGNALWEFSIQQIASCVTDCYGCGGGDTVAAYEYLMSGTNGSTPLSSAWYAPYTQSMTDSCSTRRCTQSCDSINVPKIKPSAGLAGPYATVTGYEYATKPCYGKCQDQDTKTLAENIATSGPASICVNANAWGDYVGGVLTAAACGGEGYTDVDHCVQLTGYNTTAETPYWIVKNSWSTDWGEDGYIWLEYPGNTCAVADEATFVTLGN